MEKKYVIFGAGHRGEIIAHILGSKRVVAFIDSKEEKIGKIFCGKPVISFQEYKEKYSGNIVIVSPVMGDSIERLLQKEKIFYFPLDECPAEFMGYGLKKVDSEGISIHFDLSKKMMLYGCTLYSVLVYEYLRKKGVQDISLIPHRYMDDDRIQFFSFYYPDIKLYRGKYADRENTNILITVYDEDINSENKRNNQMDIFNWGRYVDSYKNIGIERFKNIHKGERCFIVATGPSLKFEDLNKLHESGEICFSMNSIVDLLPLTKWKPDYYAVLDAIGLDLWEEKIRTIDCKASFIADSSIKFNYDDLPSYAYIYHVLTGKEVYRGEYFSDRCSEYIYNKGTITYICMQLALYMGFQKVYLLGVDFNYKPEKGNYFFDKNEYVMTQEYIQTSDYYVERAYKTAKKYADRHGVKIYNATRGGNLEVFERVDFDTLF